jgi:hypothetical protein
MAKLFRAGLESTEYINLNHVFSEPTIPERQVTVERIAGVDENGVRRWFEYFSDDEMRRLLIDATVDTIAEIERLQIWSDGGFEDLTWEDQDGENSEGWRIRPDYPMNVPVRMEGFDNRHVTFQIEKGF